MQEIRYYSERSDPAVDWVFRVFSSSIGCALRPTSERANASIVYATCTDDGSAERGQFHIPYWPAYYDAGAEHCLGAHGYWQPIDASASSGAPIDYVGLTFRLLTFTDELHLPDAARDQFGNIRTDAGLPCTAFHDRAMVDRAVQELMQALSLRDLLKEEELLPRWPHNKRYAILLTHDTDGPCLLEATELARAGVKGIVRRDRLQGKAFLEGCKQIISGGADPFFNFAHWAAFEQSLNAASAFYLYVRSKDVPNHLHNPVYRLNKKKQKWQIVRQLGEKGWEIGLHTSIYGLAADEYLQREKHGLEQFLGYPVAGARSHYWNIDWRNPVTSFQRLESSGLLYDLSIAWKDTPGFRVGTALPYHPYDKEKERVLKLLTIPTNVMDGHLFEYQVSSSPQMLFETILQQVRAYNGVLSLDWHTRTWCNRFMYQGWRDFIVQELLKLASEGDAWFTTPRSLSEYWLAREKRLQRG